MWRWQCGPGGADARQPFARPCSRSLETAEKCAWGKRARADCPLRGVNQSAREAPSEVFGGAGSTAVVSLISGSGGVGRRAIYGTRFPNRLDGGGAVLQCGSLRAGTAVAPKGRATAVHFCRRGLNQARSRFHRRSHRGDGWNGLLPRAATDGGVIVSRRRGCWIGTIPAPVLRPRGGGPGRSGRPCSLSSPRRRSTFLLRLCQP